MKPNLQDIDLRFARLSDLWRVATPEMRAFSEEWATATMATRRNPRCGAREATMARYLRTAIKAERAGIVIATTAAK